MKKPYLQKSTLPSTAVSKNLLSATYLKQTINSQKQSMREIENPMVTSFYKGSMKYQQSEFSFKTKQISEKESKFYQESDWVNTSDIESVIRRRIQADAEMSVQRDFSTQKYYLGPERICTQKIIPLPYEIRSVLQPRQESGSQREKIHLVYGYLASLNAVYYIIEQELFIFSVEELKNRQKVKISNESQPKRGYRPIRLQPNCRKIYEANFPVCNSRKMIPKQFNGKVLILQYPYKIELCGYIVNKKDPYQQGRQIQSDKNFVTLVSLNTTIPLQTASAEFITITQRGQLLYLDEKGKVVCFQFSRNENMRLQRKVNEQKSWKRKIFVSRNRGFINAAKSYFWEMIDFRHSLYFSRRKNLSMIYDQKRNRIYTLTIVGDRSTIVQQLKKVIKVYEFLNTQKGVELNCMWSISQEELMAQYSDKKQKSKINLFTILKAEPDYNPQTDLIALMSNGLKLYLKFDSQSLKANFITLTPDIESLRRADRQRKCNLIETSKIFSPKDSISKITKYWSQKIDIKRSYNSQMRMKAYFNDRSISVGLARISKEVTMYMMMEKYRSSDNEYEVFPIKWTNQNLFRDLERFPIQNEIFMVDSLQGQSQNNQILCNLEKSEINRFRKKNEFYKIQHPISSNCHQLMRQTYHAPHSFVYLTNKFMTNFTFLRPIDIVYLMVTTRQQIFCQTYLPAILGLQPFEICCMLLQLYSIKEGTFYFSRNYDNKIHQLMNQIKYNTKLSQSFNQKSLLQRLSAEEQFANGNKNKFEDKQDDQLQIFHGKLSEVIKRKISNLFVAFNRQQQNLDPNVFNKIKLRFQTTQLSTQIKDKIDELNEQKKGQAQCCLSYISRVLYPFWSAQITSVAVSRQTLTAIKEKLTEINQIVDFLKAECNNFWKHLQHFMRKLHQIVQMFEMLSLLPPNLTLEQAVSKQPSYFEPYIFNTLRREAQPEIVKLYRHRFPIYISNYFETLVKIYIEAKSTSNIEQIKILLGRLNQYPDYFLDFLKEEKGLKDLSFLRRKDEVLSPAATLTFPNLPFENLVLYLYSRVKSRSIHISEKFLYLKEAKKRMNEYHSAGCRKKQILSNTVIDRLDRQYNELFKCLKLQQECKNQILRINEQEMSENKSCQNKQAPGLFQNILSKFSLSSEASSLNTSLKEKRLSLSMRRQKQPEYHSNNQIFKKLEYLALSRTQLNQLIREINCPRLQIFNLCMFQGRGINQAEHEKFRRNLQQSYCDMVIQGIHKFSIDTSQQFIHSSKDNCPKLVRYLKAEIKQIFVFLNTIKTPLAFSPLYRALKMQFMSYDYIIRVILQNSESCIFSVGRELAELGFDKNIILNHIIYDNLHNIFKNEDLSRKDDNQRSIKSWIYDWYMGVDIAKNLKRQDLHQFLQLAKNFLKFKQENLEKNKKYKEFLQKGQKMLFNLINGNNENQQDVKSFLGMLKKSLK